MSENQILSPLNWAGKKTNALIDILEIIRKTGATRIWDATAGSGTIPYFLSSQPNLEVFASDLDPILIRFHQSFSQGQFREEVYLQKRQEVDRGSPKGTFDELRRLCNQELTRNNSVNPYLYYLFNKLELYSLIKTKANGAWGGTPKLTRKIADVPCPKPRDEYKNITWFEYNYSNPGFINKASNFDIVILDPSYWSQESHYCKKESNIESEFKILSSCKNILYFQVYNPFLVFFAEKSGYFLKGYQRRSSMSTKKRTLKELLLCTHPAAR